MQKNGDMETKNPKKTNLLDHHSIKNVLDESVTEIVKSRGYIEDVRMSKTKMFLGTIVIVIALVAQFYPKKFPENRIFLIGCILLYIVCNGIVQLIIYTKEKNAIMYTYPPPYIYGTMPSWESIFHGLFKSTSGTLVRHLPSTGLVVSSKLPRFSDMYSLTIASADPASISAKAPAEFTKSVTRWFTKDGILVEGLFFKDVEGLISDYGKESEKSK